MDKILETQCKSLETGLRTGLKIAEAERESIRKAALIEAKAICEGRKAAAYEALEMTESGSDMETKTLSAYDEADACAYDIQQRIDNE